jgi:hypothetical protein
MNLADLEVFVAELTGVQREENYGYTFFFAGDDHRLPFVTIANSDNEFDDVSDLDREGVFRLNIGVSRETFKTLVGHLDAEDIDYAALNVFLPHPDYARQHFICILNPEGENVEETRRLILEAHSIAAARLQRRVKK